MLAAEREGEKVMQMNRALVLIFVVLLVAAGVAGGALLRPVILPPPAPVVQAAPRPVAAFTFTNQNGEAVTAETYRGRWMLVFFGFTMCPDVCPLSLSYVGDFLKALGPLASRVQAAFVTVDPERDTVPVMKAYLANFDPSIVGLTGSSDQLAAAAKLFGVSYSERLTGTERPDGGPDYTMDHSTAFYLVDPEGHILRAFALDRDAPEDMTAEIRAVMAAKEKP